MFLYVLAAISFKLIDSGQVSPVLLHNMPRCCLKDMQKKAEDEEKEFPEEEEDN